MNIILPWGFSVLSGLSTRRSITKRLFRFVDPDTSPVLGPKELPDEHTAIQALTSHNGLCQHQHTRKLHCLPNHIAVQDKGVVTFSLRDYHNRTSVS